MISLCIDCNCCCCCLLALFQLFYIAGIYLAWAKLNVAVAVARCCWYLPCMRCLLDVALQSPPRLVVAARQMIISLSTTMLQIPTYIFGYLQRAYWIHESLISRSKCSHIFQALCKVYSHFQDAPSFSPPTWVRLGSKSRARNHGSVLCIY